MLGVSQVWGAEAVYKETTFSSSNNSQGISSYSNSWYNTTDGFRIDIANANNANNSWGYVKMGSKSAAYVGKFTTNSAIDLKITKVSINIAAVTSNNINSIKLYTSTSSNGSSWTERGSFTVGTGWKDVSIAAANQATNLYYKIEVDCKKSSNGTIQINGLKFYATAYTVSSAVSPSGKATVTLGTTTTVFPGKTTTATYSSITNGYEFVNWSISGTGATLSSTTTNPTTITVGSANVTVTANLQCKTPTISSNLSTAQVDYEQNATATALSVTAAAGGANLSYAWEKSANGSTGWTSVGTNNKSYTPSTADAGDWYYRCTVTNAATGCNTYVISNIAHIHVNEAVACTATPSVGAASLNGSFLMIHLKISHHIIMSMFASLIL